METAQHELENDRRVMARFSMAGRKALVTGGSVSIGREIALAFAEAGADVAIQYARQADIGFGRGDAAEEMVAAIAGRGRAGIAIDADFSRPGEPTRCVEEARRELGDIDVLVVCASIQYRTPFEEVTADQLEGQLQVNFKATIESLYRPSCRRCAATVSAASLPSAASTRSRRKPSSRSMRHSRARNTICRSTWRANTPLTVSPSTICLPASSPPQRKEPRREDAAAWKAIEADCSPMQRAGTPAEMSGAADLPFCSDAGSYITGADLQATGCAAPRLERSCYGQVSAAWARTCASGEVRSDGGQCVSRISATVGPRGSAQSSPHSRHQRPRRGDGDPDWSVSFPAARLSLRHTGAASMGLTRMSLPTTGRHRRQSKQRCGSGRRGSIRKSADDVAAAIAVVSRSPIQVLTLDDTHQDALELTARGFARVPC